MIISIKIDLKKFKENKSYDLNIYWSPDWVNLNWLI